MDVYVVSCVWNGWNRQSSVAGVADSLTVAHEIADEAGRAFEWAEWREVGGPRLLRRASRYAADRAWLIGQMTGQEIACMPMRTAGQPFDSVADGSAARQSAVREISRVWSGLR